jgi:hypothetical protein
MRGFFIGYMIMARRGVNGKNLARHQIQALLSQATFEAGLMRTIIGDPAQELQCDFENTLQLPFYLVWISLMV